MILVLLNIEIAVQSFKHYKLHSTDKILAELIQAGGDTLLPIIYKFINSIWNKEQLPNNQRSPLSYQLT
jgi:hypothetical protein